MNVRLLTDEEADALWECGVSLLRKFDDEPAKAWRVHDHGSGSPAEDRMYYEDRDRWQFGAEVDE